MKAALRAWVLLAAIATVPSSASDPSSMRMINLVVPGADGDSHLMFLAGDGKAPSVSIHRYVATGEDTQSERALPPERFEVLWRLTQATDLAAFAGPTHEHRLQAPPHYTFMIGAADGDEMMDIRHYRVPTCDAALKEQHDLVRELARDLLPANAIGCIQGAGRWNEDEEGYE